MSVRDKTCWESFCDDNKLKRDIAHDDLTPEQQNDLSDYESEWFEPALLRVTIQQDEIFISINYTDQPYYRYQYDEAIIKIELQKTIDKTITTMKKAYDEFLKEQKSS